MKVAVLQKNGETKEYEIDGDLADVDALMVCLRPSEQSDIREMPDSYYAYGRYNNNLVTREEYREWADKHKAPWMEDDE